MLDRVQLYVEKWGELTIDTTSGHLWVGGSPVRIDSSGHMSGDYSTAKNCFLCVGVAQNSWAIDNSHPAKLGSFILPWNIITIKSDSSEDLAPWAVGKTWVVGDLLRPMDSTGTTKYAVWTNDAFGSEISNSAYVYPGLLTSFTGTSTAPTTMTILMGAHVKIK